MNTLEFATLALDASIELDELRRKRQKGLLTQTQGVHDWIMENLVNSQDDHQLWTSVAITHPAALETGLVDRTMTDVNDFRLVMAARCQEMIALINAPVEATQETIGTISCWCFALFHAAAILHDQVCKPLRLYLCAA